MTALCEQITSRLLAWFLQLEAFYLLFFTTNQQCFYKNNLFQVIREQEAFLAKQKCLTFHPVKLLIFTPDLK